MRRINVPGGGERRCEQQESRSVSLPQQTVGGSSLCPAVWSGDFRSSWT